MCRAEPRRLHHSEYGRAVGYAQKAVAEVPQAPKRPPDASLQSFLVTYGNEREELIKLAKNYAQDNDSIYYEAVPPESELTLPSEARSLIKVVPLTPPTPVSVELKFVKSSECLLQ